MLGNIFKMHQYKKMIKEGKENPGAFASDQIKEAIYGLAIIPIFISSGILLILFILGFTHILTEPSTLAKISFFVILFATFIFVLLMRGFARFTSKLTKHTVSGVERIFKKDTDKVRDVTFEVKK